jgi:hypothetical protein
VKKSPSPLDVIAMSDDYKEAAAVLVINAPGSSVPLVRINVTSLNGLLFKSALA